MAKIVNLSRARKRHAQARAEVEAAENRVRHGRTKAERTRDDMEAERRRKLLDGAHHEDTPR